MRTLEQIKAEKSFKVQCKDCDYCIFIGVWRERRDWGVFRYNHYKCKNFEHLLSQAQIVAWRYCLIYLDSRDELK